MVLQVFAKAHLHRLGFHNAEALLCKMGHSLALKPASNCIAEFQCYAQLQVLFSLQRVAVAHSKFICSVLLPLCSGTLKDAARVVDKSDHVLTPLHFASTLLAHSTFVPNPSTPQHSLPRVTKQSFPSPFNPTQWPSGIWQCDTALFRCSNATLHIQHLLSTCAFNSLALNPVRSNLAFNLHMICTW